jgi:hypothetical protein
VKKQSTYPLLDTLKKLGLKPTRKNYLAIDGWDNPNRKLTAEEEMELPPQFRRQPSRPPKEVAAKKREAPVVTPEVTPKDKKPGVTVTYTRRVRTLEQQAAHDWKLENWPRCEHDDFFDMCLACITHRQKNDLVN